MAVPRLRVPSAEPSGTLHRASDEVELYHRTYTTLLRSSGETLLRVLEPSHAAMNSSLHPLAYDLEQPDLGAFLYSLRRLPESVWRAQRVVMGQEAEAFARAGFGRIEDWTAMEAPARRRRWFDNGEGTLAVLLASTSDLDDAIPSLVAYQLEWNKLHVLMRAATVPDDPEPEAAASAYGGSAGDWARVHESWPDGLAGFVREVGDRKLNLRIRMLGGSQAGYQRLTRRWWAPVRARLTDQSLSDRPMYFVSSNTHSIMNLVSTRAGVSEEEIVTWVEANGPDYLLEELERFRTSRKTGSWENFLYYGARLFYERQPEDGPAWDRRRKAERELGITHISSRTGLRVSAQVIDLAKLDPAGLDSRLGPIDADKLARTGGVVVNIEYPLGLAAYNILREITTAHDTLRGVYVLGKAATLNADVGDVLISGVIHDEHSGSTYWLDNAFTFDDVAPYLVFGSGLDNQRAVTVKSTFLQNRNYLDFYYREAYTVVEMEAGPFCNAVYEIADADRYPSGEAVNFSKLPIDFGIIHYASDTPYSQARTLGARGLSYYGLDSTYASSVAIMRRIFSLEGLYDA
ncbi:hypothetical protein OJ997_22280 [Solirubrobacter phytolaccae]|uniref:Uncharacterized protein n=1 Tax=Solirubrobacter phytolaccae TaxID=1404360 RepID=A0A9X3NAY2_9ACTN|nr:hypothetical protein [Solirubrobacter phytolaccae]MDA0183053.1 hypothetical protein [Solirubrobacter phytolaccae]